MRKLLLFISVMFVGYIYGQTSDDLSLLQSYFGKEKQQLVSDYMQLDEPQSIAFWPIYQDYENDRQAIIRNHVENVREYAQKYGELDDVSAAKIMDMMLADEVKLTNLKKKYLGKMKKAVGGITAVKFLQLENYLHNVILAQIEEQIPPIDDLK